MDPTFRSSPSASSRGAPAGAPCSDRPPSLRRYRRHGLLPQLAAFEAVVRLGSAARAAEALCIAPPTLSGHLRKLSEALGVRLFSLDGRRLVPTDAALVVLQAAREVTEARERCEETLARWRHGARPDQV
jgi:DNA-binding transcriptional LysR family regulator